MSLVVILAQSCPTLCDPMDCSRPGFPVLYHLPEPTQLHVMTSNHLILCHPLLLLPSIFSASGSFLMSQFFASGGQSIEVSASASALSMNISGLVSFRVDWLDLLAVQGTLKGHLQHHSSKASILQHSAFFMVQLSYPYMTTGKTTALTIRVSIDKKLKCFQIKKLGSKGDW